MILSVSRRTDIPNYYWEWFLQRIREGYLYVRNPMNAHQVSKIVLSPEVVDGMVFWTKNPEPMLAGLEQLQAYPYYFQFTLTGYGTDIEPGIPHKRFRMIPVFQQLSHKIGQEKVIWRYDPILFTDKYTPEYHLKAFTEIAEKLQGFTSKCVISSVDLYAKNKQNMEKLHTYFLAGDELFNFSEKLARTAKAHGIKLAACAEETDLTSCGIEPGCCIDRELFEQISGYKIRGGKDKNQRKECGCLESVEVGAYHTCKNGCLYCYANDSAQRVLNNWQHYDANAPLLCGEITEKDKVTERKVKSLKVF